MLASEAGLGGFVSSLAASLAGAYVNSEVMPQMHDAEHRPTGLGSTGTVEMEHNGHGFRSTQIDFDQDEFNRFLEKIHSEIFGDALDKNEVVASLTERIRNGDRKALEAYRQIKQAENSVRAKIIDKLTEQGATPEEIEQVLLNSRINGIVEASNEIRKRSAIQVIVTGKDQATQDAEHNNSLLMSSLNMFIDAALALDDFATENPRIAELSLTALDIAMSDPSKFMLGYCSRELGLQEKIDDCKDKVCGWISEKVSEVSGISQDTSELLISGGRFAMSFGLAFAGIQDKETAVLGEAKNVKKVWKTKIHGKAQVTGTSGHDIASMKIAIRESKKPNVSQVHMDTSLQKVTGGQVNSRMRPDVTVVSKDGRIATHEVMSKSQSVSQLKDKIEKMQKKLPKEQRVNKGVSKVFDVKGKEVK